MAGYIERLKKLLGFSKDSRRTTPVPTEVIAHVPDGDFIALAAGVKDTTEDNIVTTWNSQPAEIHIGLDFGTSFTKACFFILDKGQRHIVLWNELWNGEKNYFLPSRLWLDSENILHMAMPQKKPSREIRYFKMVVAGQPIGPPVMPNCDKRILNPYRVYTAFYLARCFDWIERQAIAIDPKHLKNREIVWSGNVGVPLSYFDTYVSRTYQEILTVARSIQKKVTDSEPIERLDALYQEALQGPPIKTFLPVPELYAEACGLFSDYHTPEGYYSLFDVGGGTVDGAVMRFERVAGEPQVNFLTASVQALGAEIFESNGSDKKKLNDLQSRLGHQTAELIMGAKQKAQSDWCHYTTLPIKMCGGGHASKCHVDTIQNTYSDRQHYRCGIPPYKVEDLQAQLSKIEGIRQGDELRLLIAVGLSIPEGQGPFIQGFPHQNPVIIARERERCIDLDNRQRELYGDG